MGTPGLPDRRLVHYGLTITVAHLARIIIDHWPDPNAPATCPGCGFRYNVYSPFCQSLDQAATLILPRKDEDKAAFGAVAMRLLRRKAVLKAVPTAPRAARREPTAQDVPLFEVAK
jgi:hypothetical protein